MEIAQQHVELIDSMGSDINIVNAARVSFAKEVEEFNLDKDYKLMQYLAKHGHWSPFAHTCISVRCKVPLFIARQLVKHQVGGNWNEESRRYISSEPEFWFPTYLHYKPENAKQGSAGIHPDSYNLLDHIRASTADNLQLYKHLISANVAPEEARMVLPLNTMTNFIWTGSLLFFRRVIEQREDLHAQLAAQEFAGLLKEVVRPVYKYGYQALEL